MLEADAGRTGVILAAVCRTADLFVGTRFRADSPERLVMMSLVSPQMAVRALIKARPMAVGLLDYTFGPF